MITLNIPTSWQEISLATFDKICKIPEDIKDYSRELIKLVLNIDEDTLNEISLKDYIDIVNRLKWMNEYPPVKKMPKDDITLNNHEYTVLLYPNRMTAAQFLDYRYILLNDESPLKQAKLLAIFLVPKNAKYNDGSYEFDDVADDIYNHMNIEYAIGLSNFFVLVSTVFLNYSLSCSARNIKKLIKREKDQKMRQTIQETYQNMRILQKEMNQMYKTNNQRQKALMKPTGHK